ncbi:unnamed protein product [Lactuca virosa]|uniref:NADP-dependent oxidoreductase domain-containing protein n=1 Tax=Lactuca virosa TaxID=75947 RepID=A0AAU9N8K2_9ASTR|nr:unnamed protein product [Lactuca virosa]
MSTTNNHHLQAETLFNISKQIKLIHYTINVGVTFLETSDIYDPKTNETLLGKLQALKGGIREKMELATKFGIREVNGAREYCGDPEYVRTACEASLEKLGVDCIDLYYQHRIDTCLPIEIIVNFFLLTRSFIQTFCSSLELQE